MVIRHIRPALATAPRSIAHVCDFQKENNRPCKDLNVFRISGRARKQETGFWPRTGEVAAEGPRSCRLWDRNGMNQGATEWGSSPSIIKCLRQDVFEK